MNSIGCGMKNQVDKKQTNEYINFLDKYSDNCGKQLFEIFCQEFSIEPNKETFTKKNLEKFKTFIKHELWIALEDQDGKDKKSTLENIPKYLLVNSTPPIGSLYNITWLSKSIWDNQLLQDVNVNINYNDKIAFIWRNGTWKTTFLKILANMDKWDSWEVFTSKWLKFGYLSQDFFWENDTVTLKEEMEKTLPKITHDIKRLEEIWIEMEKQSENIDALINEQSDVLERLNMNDWYKNYEMQFEILKHFGFDKEQLSLRINQLSWWEQTKVQIAKFILQNVDILLLDEPTNHLDIEWIIFLEKFLKKWQKWVICITHDKTFINNVFSKIREVHDKNIFEYTWNYDQYEENKIKNMELQEKKYDEQTEYIKKQKEFINKNKARKSKVWAVKTRIRFLEKMEKIDRPKDEKKIKNIKLEVTDTIPKVLIHMKNIEIGYKDKYLFTINDDLLVEKNDKIWVIWKNGIGKTTFLKSIVWEIAPLKGKIDISDKINIGYYSQVAEELNFNNSIFEELSWISAWGDNEVRKILSSLLIFGDKIYQKIATLSGGEKSKIALAKMILQNPNLLIMDEPTNHLDLYSKEAINNMLIDFPGVSIIVSHDRDLIEKISNKIRLIKDNKLKVLSEIQSVFKKI